MTCPCPSNVPANSLKPSGKKSRPSQSMSEISVKVEYGKL